MLHRLSMAWALASTSLLSELQYRSNVVATVISGFLYQTVGFITIWIVVARFNMIGGWSLPEITLLYGMRLTAHGIFYACFSQMFELDNVLIRGEFDRYLVRPVSPLVQLFTRKLRINCFGDLIGGVLLLSVAVTRVDVDWTAARVVLLIFAVIGGGLIEGAVQTTLASTSFRFLQMTAVRVTVNEIFNMYGNYPTRIFPWAIQFALTFVLPVAFVAFFPASAILDRDVPIWDWIAWLTPVFGVLLFSLAVRCWYWQSRNYQSSGS